MLNLKKYYWIIGICSILLICIEFCKSNTTFVETFYATKFYPSISYLYIILFSWVPFSVGDLIYVAIIGFIIFFLLRIFIAIINRDYTKLKVYLFKLISFLLVSYTLFYLNWGLVYFRLPIAQKLSLKTENITSEDHLAILDKYILIANELRDSLDLTIRSKQGVRGDIEEYIANDTLLIDYLCKSQVNIKEPLSSDIISYFTVSGYFNPFSMEVQVNQNIPNAGYPFVNVHELGHQMGIGFEDECNFFAFLSLQKCDDKWYRYSAYYSAIQYLLQPLYSDEVLFNQYKRKLSPKILADLKEERTFWLSYRGWVDKLSNLFYNQYLKHNNQPEGIERYNKMTLLIIAWEKANHSKVNIN